MRLIDADEVIKRIEENIRVYYAESGGGYYLAEDAVDEIDSMPIIKAKIIRYGHWVEYSKPHYFKCSECGGIVPYRKAVYVNGEREYDYCPHCGVKMLE